MPAEIRQNRADSATWILLAWTLCSGRVPVGPGAVRAALCKPEKGLSQVLSGGAGGGARFGSL